MNLFREVKALQQVSVPRRSCRSVASSRRRGRAQVQHEHVVRLSDFFSHGSAIVIVVRTRKPASSRPADSSRAMPRWSSCSATCCK
jgi:hypothetical protein